MEVQPPSRDPLHADVWVLAKNCILAFVGLVGAMIVASTSLYFPPQFKFGFLFGRESYFFSWYAVAFYAHVTSAPIALFAGLMQSIDWLRSRFLCLHRRIGYVYVVTVLFFAIPSGLAMSLKADGGIVASLGFAGLAVATFLTTTIGYWKARKGEYDWHKKWMTRSYILVCSAVQLRFMAAIVNYFDVEFITYSAMSWLCWLPSLMLYEGWERYKLYKSGRRTNCG